MQLPVLLDILKPSGTEARAEQGQPSGTEATRRAARGRKEIQKRPDASATAEHNSRAAGKESGGAAKCESQGFVQSGRSCGSSTTENEQTAALCVRGTYHQTQISPLGVLRPHALRCIAHKSLEVRVHVRLMTALVQLRAAHS
jgi:hypothetical protein